MFFDNAKFHKENFCNNWRKMHKLPKRTSVWRMMHDGRIAKILNVEHCLMNKKEGKISKRKIMQMWNDEMMKGKER
jgi:hypothetical protein